MVQDPGKVTCPECNGSGLQAADRYAADYADCSLCEGDGIVKEEYACLWSIINKTLKESTSINADDAQMLKLAAEALDKDVLNELMDYPIMPEDAHTKDTFKDYFPFKPASEEDIKTMQKIEDKVWYGKNPCCEVLITKPEFNAVKINYNPNDDYSIFKRRRRVDL